mmetsp:Transcript_88442/g.250698  ORF Transcript_88442/g.250698 Transcript_88442/m.250698 type:complete len:299 (+) Transcript_88442:134-1030(+)
MVGKSGQAPGGPAGAATAPAEALERGVTAVIDAMAGEVQFANANEAAFALLRRGCRHCARQTCALDAVEPKATVVAFLDRISARRTAARQLQELAAILVQAPGWQPVLAEGPPRLLAVLAADLPVRDALARVSPPWLAKEAPPPAQDARVFLREKRSGLFLTIAELPAREREGCVMTAQACSLFIVSRGHQSAPPDEVNDDIFVPEAGATLGFEHEGVPAFGRFLACRRPWQQALAGGGLQLCCTGKRFGRQEEFRWDVGSALQHVPSGLWLYVDPAFPAEISVRAMERSAWEALPAI